MPLSKATGDMTYMGIPVMMDVGIIPTAGNVRQGSGAFGENAEITPVLIVPARTQPCDTLTPLCNERNI